MLSKPTANRWSESNSASLHQTQGASLLFKAWVPWTTGRSARLVGSDSLEPMEGSTTSTPVRDRYDGIQGLRFVAALLVVVLHSTFYTHERLDDSIPVWKVGGIGVDIFFIISGFVMIISTTNLVGRTDGWKYFGMRRIVRIVPMYWLATTVKLLTLLVLPAAVLHAQLDPTKTILSYLFLPSRNVDGEVQPLLGVGWTLTFEMAFYAIFTVALLLRLKPLWFCSVALSALAVANIFRPEEWPPAAVYLNPIVLYFLAGMVIGQWTIDRRTGRLVAWLIYVAALWVIIPVADGTFSTADGERLTQRLTVVLLVLAVVVFDPFISGKLPRPLLYMGDASYSLYLFHPLVAPIVPTALAIVGISNGWLSVVLSVIAAVAAAAIIYRFVERPVTGLLQRRLPYVRQHRNARIEKTVA